MSVAALALLLAQLCTAEVDLGTRAPEQERYECELMYSVLAKKVPPGALDELARVARRYATVFVCAGKRCDAPRLRMIRAMNALGDEPPGWPQSAGSWSRYKPLWLARVGDAAAWLEGGSAWPRSAPKRCQLATDFGGRCAPHGACDHVEGRQPAPCGDTRQLYWLPRRRGRTLLASEAAGR